MCSLLFWSRESKRETLRREKQVMKKQQFSSIPLDGGFNDFQTRGGSASISPVLLTSSDLASVYCLCLDSALAQHFSMPSQLFKERYISKARNGLCWRRTNTPWVLLQPCKRRHCFPVPDFKQWVKSYKTDHHLQTTWLPDSALLA